jgi:hypothetical protein
MANGEMKYIGEKEEADVTLVGTSHVYVFNETYNNPKVAISNWAGANKPTITVTNTQVTIEGADGDSGHITIIEF